ncbi:MAG: signal peptidase I [Actinobacteria bacterium]|nr:signal peptidase I [Actinomycetota bacterium]
MTVDDHRQGTSERAATLAEVLSVLGTGVLVIWLPLLTREGRWPVTVLVAVAIVLGSAGVLIDLLTRAMLRRAPGADDAPSRRIDGRRARRRSDRTDGSVTTIVVIGDEPGDLQRHCVSLAHQTGPCIVLTTTGRGTAVEDLDVPIVGGATVADALTAALDDIHTDAVLLLSARAVPAVEGCRAAARHLDRNHPWVVGRTRPFNRDNFAADTGGRVSAGLRARASASGLALWEPNATLVRTEALRDNGFPSRRPRGTWLRARLADGAAPVVVDDVVALVAVPASARTFWPDSFAQQRGAAADAAAAARTEHGIARLLAALVVARESFAWVLPIWLAVLLIGTVSGELPFRMAHGVAPAWLAGVLTLRWFGLRRSLGMRLRPSSDLRSSIDRIPGSIAALPSAITARVRPGPRRVSVRPLLWAAVLTVTVLATSLIDHPPDARMTVPAVLAALLTLVVLWGLCIQVLAQRGWERTTFRIPMSLPVRVGGDRGRLLDGSPSGMAVSLEVGHDDAARPDDAVTVQVDLDDGTTAELDAQVMWRRDAPGRQVLGLSILATRPTEVADPTRVVDGDDALAAWSAQLLRSATLDRDTAPGPVNDRTRPGAASARATATSPTRSMSTRVGDALGIGLALLLSFGLLAVLGAAMLGLQVAVVRSASMTPTITQGSVVISESVPSADLRPGDVVTRPGRDGHEPVTHRIVASHRSGDTLTITTRGDANDTSETWEASARSTLQRVRWVVPSVGELVSVVRSNLALALGAVLLVGFGVLAVRLPRARTHADAGVPATT